ncbi:MAG TPA: TlpA disulfide reductase family protein [Candidatus Limnocylindrales bacterium]|nr:TlpA disulfide reductase family protein [Candidatus Limnocylindrales bacterium]
MTARPEFTHRPPKRGLIGPFGGRQLLAGAMVILVVGVLLVVVTTPLGSATPVGPNDPQATQYVLDPNARIGVRPGQIAPELEAVRADGSTFQLTDILGNPVRLADLRGKAVWINFFASWCPPCQAETPILRDLADRYRNRGLVVIGISVQETSAANVAAYAAKYQLGYTIAADVTGEIYALYRPPGLPTQIFIGPDGAVRSFVLAPLREAAAVAQVEAILPSPSQPTLASSVPAPSGNPGASTSPSASRSPAP